MVSSLVVDLAGEKAGQIQAIIGEFRLAGDHRDLRVGGCAAGRFDGRHRGDAAADHDDARGSARGRGGRRRFLDGLEAFAPGAAERALIRRSGPSWM